MRITKSRLKQIIKEELENINDNPQITAWIEQIVEKYSKQLKTPYNNISQQLTNAIRMLPYPEEPPAQAAPEAQEKYKNHVKQNLQNTLSELETKAHNLLENPSKETFLDFVNYTEYEDAINQWFKMWHVLQGRGDGSNPGLDSDIRLTLSNEWEKFSA